MRTGETLGALIAVRLGMRSVPVVALSFGLVMCGSQSSTPPRATLDASADSMPVSGGEEGGSGGTTSGGTSGGDASSHGSSSGFTDSSAGATEDAPTQIDAGLPADCPASDVGNTALPPGSDTPDPTGVAATAITYTNVGAAGSYNRVVTSTVAPSCVPNVCDTAATSVSGPLAPFDEELTLVFSGPMDIYQLAAYTPSGQGDYTRVGYWDRCTTEGLAWVGNKQWYQCNGYVQSYVSDDGTMDSTTPVQFAGHLDAGVGVNVMSDVLCSGTTDGTDCGFSRGLALHGFHGDAAGSQIFVTKFRMPLGDVTPAYWILPAQVVRSAQYGCNCRGEGGQGGCGELDVAEVLGGTSTPDHPEQATTTIYSFQGVTNGGTSYFQRPVYVTATFVVIFDAASSSIAMRRLGATDFDFGGTIPASVVGGWLANMGTVRPMP